MSFRLSIVMSAVYVVTLLVPTPSGDGRYQRIVRMPLGLTEASGLPPLKSLHRRLIVVGIDVTGIVSVGSAQLDWVYTFVPEVGMQPPGAPAVAVLPWAFSQEAAGVSFSVPTSMVTKLPLPTKPEMVNEIPS